MKLNLTELEVLLRMVYESDGYNDGDYVPNNLANKLQEAIENEKEAMLKREAHS